MHVQSVQKYCFSLSNMQICRVLLPASSWLLEAWFPYRCICRICRVCHTKKIHWTDITLWKPPVQMLNRKETTDTTFCRDRMNSICPMNFFRTTDTTDTTDTTIWKPGLSFQMLNILLYIVESASVFKGLNGPQSDCLLYLFYCSIKSVSYLTHAV